MPRVQLSPRPHYPFAVDLVVRTTDLNYGGHLGNDRLLSLVHEARVAFLPSHGWTELDCGGAALILGDAALVYQAEAFAGDLLRFEVTACEPGRARLPPGLPRDPAGRRQGHRPGGNRHGLLRLRCAAHRPGARGRGRHLPEGTVG